MVSKSDMPLKKRAKGVVFMVLLKNEKCAGVQFASERSRKS
jgi:hypothetical protein